MVVQDNDGVTPHKVFDDKASARDGIVVHEQNQSIELARQNRETIDHLSRSYSRVEYLRKADGFIRERLDEGRVAAEVRRMASPLPGVRRVAVPEGFATAAASPGFTEHRARVADLAARHELSFTPDQMDALASFSEDTGELENLLRPGGRAFRTVAEVGREMIRYRNTDGRRDPVKEARRRAEQSLFLHGRTSPGKA